MDSPSELSQKKLVLESRNFSLRISKFTNGYFVSISEGEDRLGSMVASMATGPTPITTTIVPAKSESFMLKLVAEQLSTKIQGIAIVSLSVRTELKPEIAKSLMSEIMDMIYDE